MFQTVMLLQCQHLIDINAFVSTHPHYHHQPPLVIQTIQYHRNHFHGAYQRYVLLFPAMLRIIYLNNITKCVWYTVCWGGPDFQYILPTHSLALNGAATNECHSRNSTFVLGDLLLHLLYKLKISLSVTLQISWEGPKWKENEVRWRGLRGGLWLRSASLIQHSNSSGGSVW